MLRLRSLRGVLAAVVSVSFVALALVACDDELRATDYDQSCNTASECVPIQTGQASCCGIDNCSDDAAINKLDLQQYLSDYQAAASSCGTVECPNIECAAPPVACVNNKCELAVAHPVQGQ